MKRATIFAAAAALLAVAACAHRAPPPAAAGPPVPTAAELPLPDTIPGEFSVRQKLTATSAHGGGSFQAVLQKRPGKLTLVGFAPFGARAFTLEQQGSDLKTTNNMGREPPFPPQLVLLDVYRVLGTWLGPPLADGERDGSKGGERIHERWRGGRLLERTFTRAAGDPPGVIAIEYSGADFAGIAEHVTLRNDRNQYRLSIQTLAPDPK